MAKGWIEININCAAFQEGEYQVSNAARVMEIFWQILQDTKEHNFVGRVPDDAPFKHAEYPTSPEAYWQINLKEPESFVQMYEDERFFKETDDNENTEEK